jgi:hypothetical protein
MARFFNTAGPCKPEIHYTVDLLQRFPSVRNLIDGQHFFVIHAPRQTGKTTYLYSLIKHLNTEGRYCALTVNINAAAGARDSSHAMMVGADAIYRQAKLHLPENEWPEPVEKPDPSVFPFGQMGNYLRTWAEKNPKPLVLFIEEADSLSDEMMLLLLRQLRAGFESRPKAFPHSVAFVGLKDMRNYRIRTCSQQEGRDIGSLFNIKAKSLFLDGFTLSDMENLLGQHEKETGQIFSPEVRAEIFRLTQGQPWLINALANQMVAEILENDYKQEITLNHLLQAKEELILGRSSHLENLINNLREPSVKNVAEAVIGGDALLPDRFSDDLSYLQDIGLVTGKAPIKFANPIYAEMIPRALNYAWQVSFNQDIADQTMYVKEGRLNMDAALSAFQRNYSRYTDLWIEKFDFREAGRQLLLMAFIQRIVDADGRIEREMAMGNGHCDLIVTFGAERFILVLKLNRDPYSEEDGLRQIVRYLERIGENRGYLVMFGTDPEITWEKRIYRKEFSQDGKKIILVGI